MLKRLLSIFKSKPEQTLELGYIVDCDSCCSVLGRGDLDKWKEHFGDYTLQYIRGEYDKPILTILAPEGEIDVTIEQLERIIYFSDRLIKARVGIFKY